MNSLGPPPETSFFYNNLYSFQDISSSLQQTPYPQPFVVQNKENPSVVVNSLAIKKLSQNPLKRKREDAPVKKQKSIKIPRLENLDQRIRRFGNLTETQKKKILDKPSSLIQKYYKGSYPDRVLKFISEIDNEEDKRALLTWIQCMRQRTSIIGRALEMMSEDPQRFNTKVRKYISVTTDLAEKTNRFSRYITDILKSETKKKYPHWNRSTSDEEIHSMHVTEHTETRLKLQEIFEYSNETKQNDLLINNIYKIIEISYSPITENIKYSFEEIKRTISEIKFNDQLVLLKWMLYWTKIDTVRLINLLVQYGLPLDDKLVECIEKLTYATEQKDLSAFRQNLKRREEKAIHDFAQFDPTYVAIVAEDILEAQPIGYSAFPEQPCYQTQYTPTPITPYAHNFQPYFQLPQVWPPYIEQKQTIYNYGNYVPLNHS